ncbi:MFS transporter [Rhodococcus jostii]|uniref:MFS transporter n=1 Tax=Rhodococcus jostii TaxID=132919 RepID=A0ABU4CU89_RHOJO|nr:MFS transporter [Rhodococcus jostii]MDV6286808.1 MFS transporter [Rhodococcus jostii]
MTNNIEQAATEPGAAPSLAPPSQRTREWILVVLACTGQLIVVLDVSIVNVALPQIRAALGFSEHDLQWVVTAYTLTFAGFMLIGGRAADLFGRKQIFVLSLALFTLASLAGGLAQNAVWLVIARTIQGIGGAVLVPVTLAILTATFEEGPRRTQAIATWTMMGAVGGAIGAVLGGVLTEFFSWRWVLLVNVPVGVVLAGVSLVYLRKDVHRPSGGLDLLGSVAVTAGSIAVVYGLIEFGKAEGFDARAFVSTAIGIVLLAGFVVVESQVAKSPLLPLRIVRQRAVAVANLTMFLLGAGFFSVLYFISLYLQSVRGFSALSAGLVFVPFAVTTVIGAQSAAKLLKRGVPAKRVIVGGALISAVAFAVLTTLNADSSIGWKVIAPGLAVFLGIGLALAPTAATAIRGAAPGDAGVVSGLANATRQLGGSVGLAVLTIVAAAHTADLADDTSTENAVTSGYATAFGVAAVLLVGAAIAATLLPGRPITAPAPASQRESEGVVGDHTA